MHLLDLFFHLKDISIANSTLLTFGLLIALLLALIFALGWFGLMAALLDRSGIARDLFDAMKLTGGRMRGEVALQTIFVAVILAAMSGAIGI